MPGRSTAGASRVSPPAVNASRSSKSMGLCARSGGRYASEIRVAWPSSRRRLAQNAVSTMASTATAPGSGAMSSAPCSRASARRRAKYSSTVAATERAAG
jgi:hypothetical protein